MKITDREYLLVTAEKKAVEGVEKLIESRFLEWHEKHRFAAVGVAEHKLDLVREEVMSGAQVWYEEMWWKYVGEYDGTWGGEE